MLHKHHSMAARLARWPAARQPALARHSAGLGWSLALLLVALPFELKQGLQVPGLVLTNVELLGLWALGLWLALLARERRLPLVPLWLAGPSMLFVASLLLSAVLAPAHRGEALKFALRQAQGGLLALCLAEQLGSAGWPLLRRLLLALTAGALASALLGVWELSDSSLAALLLAGFKFKATLVGGMLRLSGTFHHANIAAMYYEALLPLALVAALGLLRGRWRWTGAAAAALLYTAALLTYSRAALLTCLLILLALPLLVARRWGWASVTRRAAALSAALIAGTLLLLLASPGFRLRLLAPDLSTWYRAVYHPAPVPPLSTGQQQRLAVRLTNSGRAAWPHQGQRPVLLAYHWLDAASGQVLVFEGRRTPLPRSLAPGETVELSALVQAPDQPGRYLLAWDLVRENTGGGWFSQLGNPAPQLPVLVQGPARTRPAASAQPAAAPPQQAPLAQVQRPQLWATALRLWRAAPWLGIGPGVFQQIYGSSMGLSSWDTRLHTHNLYLEILTGSGVLGLVSLLGLLAALLRPALPMLLRASPSASSGGEQVWWSLLAALLGLLAFLVHGLLDVFLAFSATYLLFWSWIGVLAGISSWGRPAAHSWAGRKG